jgi:hypothetical protein
MLGYTPRSAMCAKAIVTVNVSTGTSSPSAVSIPSYQEFTTTIDGKQYTFYNTGSATATLSAGGYTFPDLEITEGKPLNYKYTVSDSMRYIIPNANVDIRTLKIRIQENASSSVYETWSNMDSVVNATSVTKAFWVKEIDDGLYEVNFGDGNIGRALATGNVVHMDYFVSSLEAANGARSFSYNGATLMLAPATGFYSTPGLGKNEVRLAYVLSVDAINQAMDCLEAALKEYPGVVK